MEIVFECKAVVEEEVGVGQFAVAVESLIASFKGNCLRIIAMHKIVFLVFKVCLQVVFVSHFQTVGWVFFYFPISEFFTVYEGFQSVAFSR